VELEGVSDSDAFEDGREGDESQDERDGASGTMARHARMVKTSTLGAVIPPFCVCVRRGRKGRWEERTVRFVMNITNTSLYTLLVSKASFAWKGAVPVWCSSPPFLLLWTI
jgi:hypothetical protein